MLSTFFKENQTCLQEPPISFVEQIGLSYSASVSEGTTSQVENVCQAMLIRLLHK